MNQNFLKNLLGVDDVPDEIPPALAIAIGVNGYSEEEARSIINEDAQTTERWIEAFKKANYFRSRSMTSENDDDDDNDNKTDSNLSDEEYFGNDKDVDLGYFLWQRLKKELE